VLATYPRHSQLSSQRRLARATQSLPGQGSLAHVNAPEVRGSPRLAYHRDAEAYDGTTTAYQKYRRKTVDLLPLGRGDVVLDVGCGTGLSFGLLEAKVGSTGHLLGIDASAPMVDLAAERVRSHKWDNVTLVQAPVEAAEIPVTADAALFSATHDILQSRQALENVFGHLRPGAWVAAGGGKWAPKWNVALNLCVFALHEPFVTSFNGFARPWSLLQHFVEDLRVVDVAFGGGYLALGQVATDSRP
jgi:SAM-dependent methyltransferase